jgi:GH24 family phage-related lysozyme (muramidase)
MKSRVGKITLATAGAGAIGIATFLLKPFEGREYDAYQDPVGIWTICDGATTGVKRGDFADDFDCDRMTARDAAAANSVLNRCAPGVEMPAYRRAAFIDFIYNVGPGRKGFKDGFCVLKSGNWSTMRRNLVNGDQIGACNQLPFWNKAGGQVLRGLTERRAVERLVCLGLIVDGAGNWHDWRKR